MEGYKPNSRRAKEQEPAAEKKVEQVVTGTVKPKREISKFADVFISKDIGSVKSYILLDVLLPAVKKAVSDIVRNGIDMLLYGEADGSKKKSVSSKVSYRNFYDERDGRRDASQQGWRTGYSYDDILFDTRGDAEEVLSRMDELIDMFGIVSVADLYDLAGVTGNYTDNKYGWTDISSATPARVKDGYILKLPRPMPVN